MDSSGTQPVLHPGEQPLVAFVSSVMDDEMRQPRDDAVAALEAPSFLVPWAFEYTPASSEPADWSYLRKVREADVVLWLVGSKTTEPVVREIREALAHDKSLLIIRLATAVPDHHTQGLLDEVGMRSKWREVNPEDVRDAVALSFGDEIVRTWRTKPGRGRAAILEDRGRLSRARCVQRWRAAGVTRTEALALSDDLAVGTPPDAVQPSAGQPLVVIEADVGAGKSLTGERLLQEAIGQAIADPDAPVPIWLSAQKVQDDLLTAIQAGASGIGDVARQGAMVVIDGADEAGARAAGSLLNEARIVAEAWPGMRMVITSRPLAPLERAEEVVPLPILDEESALGVVSRLSGQTVTGYNWPGSIKDAIRRPLFAVLLAVYLRSNPQGIPRSTGEMLRHLVARSVRESDADAQALLRRLARLSTDRADAPVPIAEVAECDRLRPLRDSGLIVESSGAVGFGLPILTQWFAAQGVAAGEPPINELVVDRPRLDLWRYALVIAVGELSFDASSALLDPLVRADPAFASQVVSDALAEYAHASGDLVAPPALEAGRMVRDTTATWLAGLGPGARLLLLARPDGTPFPLGARTFGDSLMTMWRSADDLATDVAELPPDVHIFGGAPGWGPGRLSRPTADPAWPWRWSLHEVVGGLKSWVKARIGEGPLVEERAWAEALAVLGAGSLHPGPLSLDDIEARLAQTPENALFRDYRRTYDLRALRARVAELREQGAATLPAPWPPPDEEFGRGGWIWDPFSDERLLERAAAVYEGALHGYMAVVERWLPTVAPRLMTYATLPATLIGTLHFVKASDMERGPALSWHLEAVEATGEVSVSLELGDRDDGHRVEEEALRRSYERLRALRPEARDWIDAHFHNQVLEVFGATPATDIAFKWLEADLKRVKLFA